MKAAPKTKLATLPIDQVIPNPRNDNQHSLTQIDHLVASVREFGQPRPVLARAANRMLISGHGVHAAMKAAGKTEIEVLLWDVDQRTADRFLLADNQLSTLSSVDQARRRELLADVGMDDVKALGFVPDEVEKLLKAHEESELEIVEIDTSDVADTFWINIVGPLQHQAVALKRLQEVMADLPGVEVQLGTTPG